MVLTSTEVYTSVAISTLHVDQKAFLVSYYFVSQDHMRCGTSLETLTDAQSKRKKKRKIKDASQPF